MQLRDRELLVVAQVLLRLLMAVRRIVAVASEEHRILALFNNCEFSCAPSSMMNHLQ